ncbi:tetratricopeptide repeat protein [Crenothrix sp.]|uniref:tetratricopeptide repeat protein n=1 Tax=Crenothrix sp. TaxID=3100433 RepID=UPI00374C9911
MTMQLKTTRQPSPADMQAVEQLFQTGQFSKAEAKAKALLAASPKMLALYNFLGLSQQAQGKYREAVASFRKMVALEPRIAEIHFNLGVILAQLGDSNEAIASYRKAVQMKPNFTVAHFNLAILLQARNQLKDADGHYRKAIAMEPGFVEALANLGTVLQQGGQLEEAEQCYRKALALRADARGYFNLGTTLYDQGKHDAAISAFREAVQLDAQFADAWNSLGETLRDRGAMDDAIRCYEQALAVQPNHGRAQYNLGEYFCLINRLQDAIAYFENSDFADAKERALQCYYKTRQFEVFKHKFDQFTANNRHTSVLLGTLSTHYATNFGVGNTYNFCKNPMDYVLQSRIDELIAPDSHFLAELLHNIQHLAIAERKQGRLYYGMQSAGNLLMRTEASFQKLAAIIRNKVLAYRQHFADSDWELILSFPRDIEFASSWYLRMKQGGYLTSHIHEEGWISGCIYLKLPEKNTTHEGSFAYSTDGDDYPRLHDNFPSRIVDIQVGDLVLFPSSLFHRTVPFHADQERVCVAFDVKPALGFKN